MDERAQETSREGPNEKTNECKSARMNARKHEYALACKSGGLADRTIDRMNAQDTEIEK